MEFEIINLYKVANKFLFFEGIIENLSSFIPQIFYTYAPYSTDISLKDTKINYLSPGKYLNNYTIVESGNLIIELLSLNDHKQNGFQKSKYEGDLRITAFYNSIDKEDDKLILFFKDKLIAHDTNEVISNKKDLVKHEYYDLLN